VRQYTIIVTREDDAFIVDVPALPGCHTFGNTYEEALANAQDAIQLYLEDLRASGEPIPEDVQTATVQVAA
jgi:antitoxin HicB